MGTTDPLLELPCFAGLSRAQAGVLLRHVDTLLVPDGWSRPVRRGTAREAVLVVTGSLAVLGPRPGAVGPGGTVDLLALVDSLPPREQVLRAAGPCRLGLVCRTQARVLLQHVPAFAALVRQQRDLQRAGTPQPDRAPTPDPSAPGRGPSRSSGRVLAASPPP